MYMQARYYDPVIGRFYSNDPVDAMGHNARGNPVHVFGRYTYANNNPYKYTDPDGQFAFLIPLAGAAVGGVIGAASEILSGNTNLSDIGKSAAIGAGFVLASTMPVGGGVLGAMAMSGAANAGGEMANQLITGEFAGSKVLEKGAEGLVGGAVGKAAAKLAVGGRGLSNNSTTQAAHNMTESSSQRVLAGSKSLSTTPGNRAVTEVKAGVAYGTGVAVGDAGAMKLNEKQ